jgi:hypothetical protein
VPLAKRAFDSAVASERHAVVTGDSPVGSGSTLKATEEPPMTDEMMSLRELVTDHQRGRARRKVGFVQDPVAHRRSDDVHGEVRNSAKDVAMVALSETAHVADVVLFARALSRTTFSAISSLVRRRLSASSHHLRPARPLSLRMNAAAQFSAAWP